MPQYMIPTPLSELPPMSATEQNLTAEKLDAAIKKIQAQISGDNMSLQGLQGALGRLERQQQFPMTSPDPGHSHSINDPGHSHSIGAAPMMQPKPGRLSEQEYWEVLRLRMRLSKGRNMAVKHMSLFVDDDKAYVFIVGKTGPVVLEDEVSLFPSDALIGQLILIEEGNRTR